MVKLVCDLPQTGGPQPQLSQEALKQVKQIVTEYLPGANLSDMHLSQQRAACTDARCANYGQSCERHCPTSEPGQPRRGTKSAGAGSTGGRVVVTVSKQVTVAQHVHKHYVRVTLDAGGSPVKLSISR